MGSWHDWPRAPLPFSSKRLTAEQIKHVGRALEVPTEALISELHLMIEGKLRELDQHPANVQVLVGETGMSLWDEGEEFMRLSQKTMKVKYMIIILPSKRLEATTMMKQGMKLSS